MKSINGYRVINPSKKPKVYDKLQSSQQLRRKRVNQTSYPRQKLPSEDEEEFQEDDPAPYSDMEDEETSEEVEPVNDEKRIFTALKTTVRPLLKLLSEDSCPASKPSPVSKPQIYYKDICLSSEEEPEREEVGGTDDEEKAEAESVANKNHIFLGGRPKNPTQINIPSRSNSLSRFVWSPKSTNILLELWEKNLKDIRGKRKNAIIHREMAAELRDYGPSPREIKSKMDNMARKYRLETSKIEAGGVTTWRYYHRVQSLVTEAPAVDFEEIMFDTTESSTFFQSDNSEASSENNEMGAEYDNAEEAEQKRMPTKESENLRAEEQEDDTPSTLQSPQKVEYGNEADMETSTAYRMLEIEEEKLAVEKQKLQVMKHISRDLTSISKTLVEILRNTKFTK